MCILEGENFCLVVYLEKSVRQDQRERCICYILFDLEMGNEINNQPPSHLPQFWQFLSGTDQGGILYLYNLVPNLPVLKYIAGSSSLFVLMLS